MLTSGSSNFFVQNLGNLFAGQMDATRLTRMHQRHFDAAASANWLSRFRARIRNGNDRPFWQGRPAVEYHDAILYVTCNHHFTIVDL